MKTPDIDFLRHIQSSFDHLEPAHDSFALLVRKHHRFHIRDPAMNTTSPRIHPENVPEAELYAQRSVEDFYGDSDIAPASLAYPLSIAASSNFVIIRHIDIKNKFALQGL